MTNNKSAQITQFTLCTNHHEFKIHMKKMMNDKSAQVTPFTVCTNYHEFQILSNLHKLQ